MNQNLLRGYVVLGAIGLLSYILYRTATATWHGGHVLALTLAASLLTPYALGLLRAVGLGVLTDAALRAIRYTEETKFHNYQLWNKIWVRSLPFWLAFFVVKMYTGWGSLVIVGWATWWLYRRQRATPRPDVVSSSDKGGFVFQTDGGPLWLANPYRGVFINGGPGSGKSKSIIEPMIQQAGAQGLTGLVYDFKFPTLAGEVAGSYSGSDVTPYYVNFTDARRSHRLNPVALALLPSVSYAREAALTVLTNLDVKAAQQRSFWIQSAEVLLTGAIWYLRNNHPDRCTLPHAVSLLLESDPRQLLTVLRRDDEVRPLVASVSSGAGSEAQLAGVFATVQNYLSVLVSPVIYWVLSGDDVPFALNSPQQPGILTVGNDPALTGTFSPLVSLIVATALKRMNTPGQRPSVVLLDEAPTLVIPNFQQIPATGRSNRIATVYAVQDLSQMVGAFGREGSEMILGSLASQFYGRTTSPEAAGRISRMFGRHDQEFTGRTVSHSDGGSSYSQSRSVQQRDRLEVQQVMRFEQGEFAGVLAEGSSTEFQRRFKAPVSQARPIEAFADVSEDVIRAQFTRIKEDVNRILNPVADEPTASAPATTAPDAHGQSAQPEPEDWQSFI